MKSLRILLILFAWPLLTGCAHKQARAKVPPPPDIPPAPTTTAKSTDSHQLHSTSGESGTVVIQTAKPIYTEMGLASWYGAPYHNRRGANGEIYDMNGMTAAHRTLPLNSIVRVTNVKTGNSAIVRITDRGPFIGERMLDLSLAAAKAVDVWSPGTAWVKMDVLESPAPLDSGGKWAVQIGAFDTLQAATEMKQSLINRYHPARVLEFAGPTGEWVRVRVQNDDHDLAQEISRSISTAQGGVFLVRLD